MTHELEDVAVFKRHKTGKCPNSRFATGWHRVGDVPYYSLVDGGAPGCVLKTVCLECGREWYEPGIGFLPMRQPNTIGKPAPVGGEARQ